MLFQTLKFNTLVNNAYRRDEGLDDLLDEAQMKIQMKLDEGLEEAQMIYLIFSPPIINVECNEQFVTDFFCMWNMQLINQKYILMPRKHTNTLCSCYVNYGL